MIPNMIKKIIVIALMILPTFSFCQQDTAYQKLDERMKKASAEFIKFDNQFRVGITLEILGGIIAGVGTNITDGTPVIIGGGILAVAGLIINASSSAHVRNAGIYLRANGIVIPLHNKPNATNHHR